MTSLQIRIWRWGHVCFGELINQNTAERTLRFLEESLELTQSLACTKEDVLRMVDYVYSRPIGDVRQEFGGVGITLNLLATCTAYNTGNLTSLEDMTELELQRCWECIEKIREKQKGKPVKAA